MYKKLEGIVIGEIYMFLILDMFFTIYSWEHAHPMQLELVKQLIPLLCTAPWGFIPNFSKDILKQNPLATALVKLNQYVITCDAWLQPGWTLALRHSAKHVRDRMTHESYVLVQLFNTLVYQKPINAYKCLKHPETNVLQT